MMNLVIIFISVLLNSAAQILIRKGMMGVGQVSLSTLSSSLIPMITNYWLWLAMMCYALSIVTWMMALSKFEVSYAYPFLSIGYILATVVGYFFLGESITISKIIGIGVICIGIVILSRG